MGNDVGFRALLGASALAVVALADAPVAEACGGFFCSGPSSCTGLFCTGAPTQQSGENILFAVEGDGTLSVHVQILYTGDSATFAWILPLPSVPTSIGVGTDDLFAQLEAQTMPRFELAYRTEGTCRRAPACDVPDAGSVRDAALSFADGAAADAGGGGPTIHLREQVGPYDAVVLSGSSAMEVLDWLRGESFDIPSATDPLIADYVAAGHVFVAIRLLSDRTSGEIQPLILRYAEGQPCVPLRLTALAATPDMPITAYFLADAFAAPENYSLVEPTFGEARLWTGALSYRDYVGRAIDDVGGQGFVTDYAGAVPSIFLERAAVDDLAAETDPATFLSALFARGYASDPQLLGILPRFLPVPDGQTPQSYYNCLSSGFRSAESCGYGGGFDPAALAMAIETQIRAPRAEAQAMLARHARLTRLYTSMDPSEMSLDPTFRIDPGLPAVSNVHTATQVTECSEDYVEWQAPMRLDLPDGTSATWRPGTRYTTDAEYCRSIGLLPPGTHAMSGGGPGSSSGGGSCTVSSAAGSYGGGARGALAALMVTLALALVRRRRDRR